MLGTFFAILDYARKCGLRVPDTTLPALTITADRGETETPYFRPDDTARIIAGAKEPYRTIFALAWCTGCAPVNCSALQEVIWILNAS